VSRAINRVLPKYAPLLERARERGEDEVHTTYDELRIEALEIVLTRQRRQDFLNRYDAMLRRLMKGHEEKKLEQALIVRPLLNEKGIPWGANALITEIFEEAKDEAAERIQRAEDTLVTLLKNEIASKDENVLRELIQDPERLKELAATLDFSKETLEELGEMTDRVLAEFERSLLLGEFELDLFSDEELEDIVEQTNIFASAQGMTRGAEPSQEHSEEIVRIFRSFIGETVTEERIVVMEHDLDDIEREWLAARVTEAALLRIERDDLREIEPSENGFLFCTLVGQIRRAQSEPIDDDEAGVEPEQSDSAPGLRERVSRILRRR
jgi:hypothetical protein